MSEDIYHVSRILSAFLTYVLVLLRCGCIVVFAPFFSSEVFSGQVRIYFAMVFPLLFLSAASRTAQIPASMDMTRLAILAGQEFALGMAIAYLGTFVFTAIQFAGEIVGQQIGFSMASVMDPQSGVEMPMLGFINMNLGIISFIIAKLHIVYIYIMLKSYEYVGIGGLTPDIDRNHPVLAMALLQISTLIRLGIQMAGPIVLIMLLTSVAEGFVTKTMPQMNVQVFGMPVKVAVGLTALMFLYPALCAALIPPDWRFNLGEMPDGPFGEMLDDLSRMVAEMGTGTAESGYSGAF
ncbi:MAG: flagellar biosynthetic protein FliR [Planctomycetota bacterium]|jgi:flagellar biosynthetic protein FliR|nr:flagellar biosynthetic protein FliR [Planctomycetota bacterium]